VTLSIADARAEALFVSTLQPSSRATRREIRDVIAGVVRAHGSRAVAARVAQEFGDHPEAAAARMEWAASVVAATYPPRRLNAGRAGIHTMFAR
jgi:hypothetical protein